MNITVTPTEDESAVHATSPSTLPPITASPLSTRTPWQAVVAAFLDSGVDSANTRTAYRRHLVAAFTAMPIATVADLSGADLARYRTALTTARKRNRDGTPTDTPLSPASVSQALAALRAFLRWSGTIGAHNLPDAVIAAALRTPKAEVQKPYNVLTEPEVAAVLRAAPTLRDRAVLAVLIGGGLRVSEVVGLDVRDIREDGAGGTTLYLRQAKGRNDRQVPVRVDVAGLLRAYLHQTGRRLGENGPLFLAHDRAVGTRGTERLTVRAVDYLVRKVTARAGIQAKVISAHSLRHSFAVRALRGGANVVAVGKVLGHANISTTQKYVDHLDLAELREALPALPVGDEQ